MKRKLKKTNKKVQKKTHWRSIFSVGIFFTGIIILLSQFSYLINWKKDFSAVSWDLNSEPAGNWLGKLGVFIGHYTMFKGFGIASLLVGGMLLVSAFMILKKDHLLKLIIRWIWTLIYVVFISWFLGLIVSENPVIPGITGIELAGLSRFYIGKWGSLIVAFLIFSLIFIYKFKLEPEFLHKFFVSIQKPANQIRRAGTGLKERLGGMGEKNPGKSGESVSEIENETTEKDISIVATGTGINQKDNGTEDKESTPDKLVFSVNKPGKDMDREEKPNGNEFEIKIKEDELVSKPKQPTEEFGEFDPTLELRNYKFPHFGLLKDYSNVEIALDEKELQENNDKIVKTLQDFGIEIIKIEANVGPSVTLYEIIPKPGIRISKIKNLEDDIAMSLSALGIRIIAPMPGRGTIGIEVPNKNPVLVPLKRVLKSKKFQNAKMQLPIALGKTISNETFVFDLTKMPHLLIAGATGQGKSVGLNVIINSLLFKKHPAELKFVMVDPKKVELSLYNTIENHFLAKLPDEAEAIISDVTKVKQTLNSLVKEMENRYLLLQKAKVRNVIEYNNKFKQRRLNPNNGHRFLPYIVLIIDEFGDFMMTAGKEVEAPIARLAQMARAVGIHIIIATQRPSVNIITGLIKANFPARIAFRVASQVDSRTILDQSGAEKLVGKGDMLITTGNDLIRLQCAFIDTDEVEAVTDFIGEQPGYSMAYELPEPEKEDGLREDLDEADRDPLFKEAAYLIVSAQQGSASLLQRKLSIGYNRAGRLIDQLEQAGIVGPSEGSKPRTVHIKDISELDKFFDKI